MIAVPVPDPPDGFWSGTTDRAYPVSFRIIAQGTQWKDFKLKTNFVIGGCSGTTEVTISSGTITNNQFSYSSSTYSFTGQLDTLKTASGTYTFTNRSITSCGTFSQSGTWSAQLP
jgi:hypothetical protein